MCACTHIYIYIKKHTQYRCFSLPFWAEGNNFISFHFFVPPTFSHPICSLFVPFYTQVLFFLNGKKYKKKELFTLWKMWIFSNVHLLLLIFYWGKPDFYESFLAVLPLIMWSWDVGRKCTENVVLFFLSYIYLNIYLYILNWDRCLQWCTDIFIQNYLIRTVLSSLFLL